MSAGLEYALELMEKINEIDLDPVTGGVNRLAFSREDLEGRQFIKKAFLEAGLRVREDGVGNIWALKEGDRPDLPAVAIGSHIDTVPDGGKYDGLLGVVLALGLIRDFYDKGISHDRSLCLIVFAGEESSRFGLAQIGSKSITGALSLKDFFSYSDKNGVLLFKAMRNAGLEPEKLPGCRLAPTSLKSFIELHIEQGPVLDSRDIPIGIVEAIAAPTRLTVKIKGEAAHSGACPMNLRRDSLAAAAEIILAVESAGREEHQFHTVATTGVCRVSPGAMNVVPGRTDLEIDIRGIDRKSIARTVKNITDEIDKICAGRKMSVEINFLARDMPVTLDPFLQNVIVEVCKDLGVECLKMSSGAGHDAMYIAGIIPTSMIFIPSRNGISHSPAEYSSEEDIRIGYAVLRETVDRLL